MRCPRSIKTTWLKPTYGMFSGNGDAVSNVSMSAFESIVRAAITYMMIGSATVN